MQEVALHLQEAMLLLLAQLQELFIVPLLLLKFLNGKNRLDPGGIALIIFTILISYYIGAIVALIPIAYCSTLSIK